MAKLVWDQTGERLFETGVEKTVLFPMTGAEYGKGVAWNGVTTINETPSGGEPTDVYADDQKYLTMYSLETLGGTIEAYMYPDEFAACNGEASPAAGVVFGQQTRKGFGLAFETLIGNDTESTDHGKKLHLLYGCKVSPSEMAHQTVNESPEATTMSWEFTTDPIAVEGYKSTSRVIIDSTKVGDTAFKALEDYVQGSADEDAALPLPAKVLEIIASAGNAKPPKDPAEPAEPQG